MPSFSFSILPSTPPVCVCVLSHFRHVWLFVTTWTVTHQAPLSMGFSKQEYWSGLPCPPPGIFLTQGSILHLMWLLHCRWILYHWSPGEAPISHIDPLSPSTDSLARLPLFSEGLPIPFSSELIRNCPFQIKPFGDPEAQPLISNISWTKAELQATVKLFPKVTEDPHRFAEYFSYSNLSTWFLQHISASSYACQWRQCPNLNENS